MNYTLAVIHPVPDIDAAAAFLADHLGFEAGESGNGYRVVSNGTVTLRLVEGDGPLLTLDVKSRDLERDGARFLATAGNTRVTEQHFVSIYRAELTFATRFNIQVTLSRRYTDDDLGLLPQFETSLEWDSATLQLVQRLLRIVPLDFRPAACDKVVTTAEAIAASAGHLAVEQEQALRGLIAATPLFQHAHLRELLRNEGVDADPLFPSADG